jgi:hypothetical protein
MARGSIQIDHSVVDARTGSCCKMPGRQPDVGLPDGVGLAGYLDTFVP